jgi:hypothetical protein
MSGKFYKSSAAIRDLEELFQYFIERNVSGG